MRAWLRCSFPSKPLHAVATGHHGLEIAAWAAWHAVTMHDALYTHTLRLLVTCWMCLTPRNMRLPSACPSLTGRLRVWSLRQGDHPTLEAQRRSKQYNTTDSPPLRPRVGRMPTASGHGPHGVPEAFLQSESEALRSLGDL